MNHKAFKNKIESAERTPEADVWGNIEKQLDLLNQPSQPGRNPKGWVYALLFLSLGLLQIPDTTQKNPLSIEPKKEIGRIIAQPDTSPKLIQSSPIQQNEIPSDPIDRSKLLETKMKKTSIEESNTKPEPKEEDPILRPSHPPMALLPQRKIDPLITNGSALEIYSNLKMIPFDLYVFNSGTGNQYFYPSAGISLLSVLKDHQIIQDLNQTIQKIKSIETVVIKY
jgi:hypothetical protein